MKIKFIPLTAEQKPKILQQGDAVELQIIMDDEEEDSTATIDRIFALRFIDSKEGQEWLNLMLHRNETTVFSIEILLHESKYFKPGVSNLDVIPLFPFFDEEDRALIESTLFMMAFAIDDFTQIPLNLPPVIPPKTDIHVN